MIKKTLLISLCLTVVMTAVNYYSLTYKTTLLRKSDFTVVIDPGHGGIDPGVTGVKTGEKESTLNLYLAEALYKRFYADGINVILTRNSEAGLHGNYSVGFKLRDLNKRVEIADKSGCDLFISLHMNKFSDAKRRGAQVFYKAGDEKSKLLSNVIQNQLNGMEESEREFTSLAGDYYVLNKVKCAAVLIECGFLSNEKDEKLLLTKEYREKIAHEIFYGVVSFYGKEYKT